MSILEEAAEKLARHILETEDKVIFNELLYGARNETLLREYWNGAYFDGDDLFSNILLSEDFLREIIDEITPHHWEIIALNQHLSKSFIKEFKDKVWLYPIWDKMSLDFRRRYKELNNKKNFDKWY